MDTALKEAAEFAGFAVVIWLIVGAVRAALPTPGRIWLRRQPERVWLLVYVSALLLLLLMGQEVERALFLQALNLSVAAIGADRIRNRTPVPSVDDAVDMMLHRETPHAAGPGAGPPAA